MQSDSWQPEGGGVGGGDGTMGTATRHPHHILVRITVVNVSAAPQRRHKSRHPRTRQRLAHDEEPVRLAPTWPHIGRALRKVCEVSGELHRRTDPGSNPTLRKGDETLLATVEDRRRQDYS